MAVNTNSAVKKIKYKKNLLYLILPDREILREKSYDILDGLRWGTRRAGGLSHARATGCAIGLGHTHDGLARAIGLAGGLGHVHDGAGALGHANASPVPLATPMMALAEPLGALNIIDGYLFDLVFKHVLNT